MFQTMYLWWTLPFWFCVPSLTYQDYWQAAAEHFEMDQMCGIPNMPGF
jgi:hypothetical protein